MSEAQPVSAKIRTALSHFLHTSPKDIDDAVLDHITSFTDRELLARFVKDFVCDVEEADVAAFVDLVLPASNLLSGTNSLKRPVINDLQSHKPCGTASSDTREVFIPSSSREEEELELLGNCIQCGKIAFGTGTEKRSDVVCSFCGNTVAAVSSFHPLQTTDATSSTEETLSPTALAALEEAIKRKNVLLEFQRTATERTRIYDDATDWYRESANTWISEDERQKALCLANEHELKKKNRARMVALDFANQRVLECPQETSDSTFYDLRRSHIVFGSNAPELTSLSKESTQNLRLLSSSPRPPAHLNGASLNLYQELQQDLFQNRFLTPTASKDPETSQKAIYEEEEKDELASFCNDGNVLNENAHDKGVCLTLHQPYASLLVRGIKRMEGRSWATAHRGRLWIHAAQRVPPPEEIVRVETEYSALYKTSDGSRLPCPFPTSYPTSALLGCVTLIDCLSQDEYQTTYRQKCEQNQCCVYEPNASPYIFVCEAPRQLAVPVHMSGNHKLWALPQQRIRSLQCALFRA